MKEKIFNLYFYSNNNIINKVGAVCHELEGTTSSKINFLKCRVNIDYKNAMIFDIPEFIESINSSLIINSIDYTTYRDLCNSGNALIIFENVFQVYDAPENPLVIISPVVDGLLRYDGVENIITAKMFSPNKIRIINQEDWLKIYFDNNGLHIDRLINDDFFEPIKLLYNQKYYVSSIKLLVICIDTISYLEYGDITGAFIKWLDNYCSINELEITSVELWEFRNSLLHMSNLDSRKVKKKIVRRLMFYVSDVNTNYSIGSKDCKYFKYFDLVNIVSLGIVKWGETYNSKPNKIIEFINRYDRIISEKRMTSIIF
jgi:hypothetical protein